MHAGVFVFDCIFINSSASWPLRQRRVPFPQTRPAPARPVTLCDSHDPPSLGIFERTPGACVPYEHGEQPHGHRRGHEAHQWGCPSQAKLARTWRRSQPHKSSLLRRGCIAKGAVGLCVVCVALSQHDQAREAPPLQPWPTCKPNVCDCVHLPKWLQQHTEIGWSSYHQTATRLRSFDHQNGAHKLTRVKCVRRQGNLFILYLLETLVWIKIRICHKVAVQRRK